MGGKKKPAAAAKKSNAEPDESTEKLYKLYKKKCNELQCPFSTIMNEKFNEYRDEGTDITKVHLWEELGWAGIRALMDALKEINYLHAFSLRLWKTFCEDEGVRAICQWLEINRTIRFLELLDNRITPLGCEFIGRILHPKMGSPIHTLKLDHNDIGSAGVAALAEGLAMNKVINTLSLTYCNIDEDGARPLFEILIYTKSQLKELDVTGNRLRNEGVVQVLKGVQVAKSLEKIYLADNQFGEEENVLQAIKGAFVTNQELKRYDFRFNAIYDDGVTYLTQVLEEAPHVWDIEISERVKKEVLEEFKAKCTANKPKKGKKGKGGKKKKKK